ncbi:hypothetical protein BBP40_002805 [Aspergillus hancockii]|nr:hypothetical protein BBP40_002805 [Aspergillus hancockii]
MESSKQSSLVASRWNVPIARCSLPYFVFGAPHESLSEKKVLIDTRRPEDRSLSLAEYRSLSIRVAVGLKRLGVQPKDRILCVSGNALTYPALLMGTVMAGCIFVPGSPGSDERELKNLVAVAKPSVILTHRIKAEVVLHATGMAPGWLTSELHRICIFDDDILDGTGEPYLTIPHWQEMVGSAADSDWEYPDITSPEDYHSTVVIMFTSGTTGSPKGVEISHHNYIAASVAYMHRVSLHPDWHEASQPTRTEASPIRVLGALAMHHILGQRSYSAIFPKLGVPLYLSCQPNPKSLLDAVERFKISDAIIRSSVLTEIAKDPKLTHGRNLTSLKRVEACAAPMGQSTKTTLEQLGIGRVTRVWGLTELGLISGHDMTGSSCSESAGELHANYEGKVTDPSDPTVIVDRNIIGDIWIRTPSCSTGYYRNPDATAEVHGIDGWFCTGDVGYVDEKGMWYIVDRKKDLIKVNGNHVAPTELEAVLLRHPDIVDVGVIGVAVNQDEGPRAYIQRAPNSNLSVAEVHEFLAEKVTPHKYLSGGVSFTPKIPRNSNGKIVRLQLRETAKLELGDSRGHYHGIPSIVSAPLKSSFPTAIQF